MKQINDIKELNGEKSGGFTIVIDEEKNSLAVTGRFSKGDAIVYVNELSYTSTIDDIKSDLAVFGFEFELIEKKKDFKILFDKKQLKVLATSQGCTDKVFRFFIQMLEKKLNKKISTEEAIDYFSENENYQVITLEV